MYSVVYIVHAYKQFVICIQYIRKEYHGYSEDKQNQLLVFE